MRNSVFAFLFFFAGYSAFAQTTSPANSAPLVRGSAGLVITGNDVLSELKSAPETERKLFFARPNGVEQLTDSLLTRRTLAVEAMRDGLDKDPVTAAAVAIARDRVLSVARLAKLDAVNTPNDATLDAKAQALYNESPVKFSKPARTRASHILLPNTGPDSLQKAKDLLSQLRAGVSFEALAKTQSTDMGSAANGGNLGFFAAGQVVPAFEEAVNALAKPGDLSEPVESKFGLHIIRLDERREKGIPPYEEIRAQMMSDVRTAALNEGRLQMVEKIKKEMVFDKAAIEAFVNAENR